MTKPISIFVLVTMLVSINSFSAEAIKNTAEDKPFDCITALMSQPSCINRLNASNACKFFENSPAAVEMIQKCVVKQGFAGGTEIMAPRNIVTLCLAGSSWSNKAKDNETFCKVGDDKKSLSINDTQTPKEKLDSDIKIKTESSSIQK